eukprot:TRINITY_DN65976_c0_g1_i1.p1 TRINITY_DN65976_c0_g1~~TRINITY_DN65976_c0_g1_i1.p1  ORF type:complete len:220 (-),score=54.41 TRINITY_DN65976_c0_g1_i1:205-813(-)
MGQSFTTVAQTNCGQCEAVAVETVDAVLGYDGHPDGDLRDTAAMNNHKLLAAARDGDEELLKEMIDKGVEVDKRRPFFMKREREDVDPTVGADGGLRDTGLTPLMYAAQGSYPGACRILLEAHAEPNCEDEDGLRALHFAAAASDKECCKLLIEFRADPRAITDEGKEAIDWVPGFDVMTAAEKQQWRQVLAVPDNGAKVRA